MGPGRYQGYRQVIPRNSPTRTYGGVARWFWHWCAGQYDRHAGRYLDIHDDLDAPITSQNSSIGGADSAGGPMVSKVADLAIH